MWYRAGMCPAQPTGSHWALLETGHREAVRQVLGYGGALWALDGQGALCCNQQGAREDVAGEGVKCCTLTKHVFIRWQFDQPHGRSGQLQEFPHPRKAQQL